MTQTTHESGSAAAVRLLELAARDADAWRDEARAEADTMVADARSEAERIRASAQFEADRMLVQARGEAERVRDEITRLEGVESATRTRIGELAAALQAEVN